MLDRFIHPATHLILDHYAPPDTFDSPMLPTVEEVRSCIPNPTGWATGIEDAGINNGVYLDGLVQAAEVGADAAGAELAQRIFDGLVLLATAGNTGFVARYVLPDRETHYPNSSVDQYTMAVYGLWRFHRSSIADADAKRKVEEILDRIAWRVRRDEYTIARDDGNSNVFVCDLELIRPDRGSRLLEVFRAAHDVTGNEAWRQEYLKKVLEDGKARLHSAMDDENVRWCSWGLHQTAVSLRLLYELEDDEAFRQVYEQSLSHIARRFEPQLENFRREPGPPPEDASMPSWRALFRELKCGNEDPAEVARLCDAVNAALRRATNGEQERVRVPFECAMSILLTEDDELIGRNRDAMADLFAAAPFDECKVAHSLAYVEETFWWGVKKGLWQCAG